MSEINLPDYLDFIIKKIWHESNPVSIFLYGSMSRDDFVADSDYEIGIVYKKDNRWTRQQLKDLHDLKNVKLYPFMEEELNLGIIDTPFPKAIYLHSLLESKTILGKDIKEIVKVGNIQTTDLYESVGFCLGRAYSAVVSSRQEDWEATRDGFTKAVFYGLQVLLLLKTEKLYFSYNKIIELTQVLVDDEYKEVINHAVDVRKSKVQIKIPLLFKAVSFLNRQVLASIKEQADKSVITNY
ncbi:MAG: hypothetical protein WCT01_03445 [Candidatus Shapirobacteria bacterium]|jgi:predicted nucleotidyltransferase